MKPNNNKSGFTLIEIIVVLIIVGILAAIALPNMFANVIKGKAATAIAAMDGIKAQVEACAAQNNAAPQVGGLCSPQTLGLASSRTSLINGFYFDIAGGPAQDPNTFSGQQIISTGSPSAGNLTYSIIAYDSTPGVGTGYEAITLNRGTDGTFTCSAPTSGPLQGAC